MFVGVHKCIQRGAIHQPFLDKQRFKGFHTQCEVGRNRLVIVIVVLPVSHVLRRNCACGGEESSSS
jgi:hypothetical protein